MIALLPKSRNSRVVSARRQERDSEDRRTDKNYTVSSQSQIRVSVSEYEDGDPDDIFNFGSSPTQSRTRSPESRVKVMGKIKIDEQNSFYNSILFAGQCH